ncbi:Shedu immune nuclease family protein [Umezawaea sp.]|uniref:Shedu immune nuclease family protein n=1 Tax=Umezawaea sp. TaxID=1955258 RepID=UPI002ED37C18
MTAFSVSYRADETEFSVSDDDFSMLEIRDSGSESGFQYFYDTKLNRLITDFVLKDGPQVATLCQVTLIKKDGKYAPRLRFWKKDKTNKQKKTLAHVVAEDEVTRIIKATVDTSDAHKNVWKLIHFLQSFTGVELPDDNFRVVAEDSAQLAELLESTDKQTVLEAVRIALGGGLTEEDMLLLSNRKAQLKVFEKLLTDKEFFEQERVRLEKVGPEALWQAFFEANTWIFGYGLKLVACEPLDPEKMERITTGANIFTGAGKRVDAILRSKGYISSLLFCEIKTHEKSLLASGVYRKPDVYRVSDEVSGGLSQIQKTVSKALMSISRELHDLYKDDGTPTGIQFSTIKPRQALIIGNLDEFKVNGAVNPQQLSSFELFRQSFQDVEIITFDELYERACFIVRDS